MTLGHESPFSSDINSLITTDVAISSLDGSRGGCSSCGVERAACRDGGGGVCINSSNGSVRLQKSINPFYRFIVRSLDH